MLVSLERKQHNLLYKSN